MSGWLTDGAIRFCCKGAFSCADSPNIYINVEQDI